jgi:hypothetical protein
MRKKAPATSPTLASVARLGLPLWGLSRLLSLASTTPREDVRANETGIYQDLRPQWQFCRDLKRVCVASFILDIGWRRVYERSC